MSRATLSNSSLVSNISRISSASTARRSAFVCPTSLRTHRSARATSSRSQNVKVAAIFTSPTLFSEDETEEDLDMTPATWFGMPVGVDLGDCPKGMNRYQTTFLMGQEADMEAIKKEIESIEDCLKEAGAIAVQSYCDGLQPVAYEIKGNIDCYYVYINYVGPPKCASYLQEVQARPLLEGQKLVLRYMTEKFPKNYQNIFGVWKGGTPPTPQEFKKTPEEYEWLPWQLAENDWSEDDESYY